jgi:hypothetical protein
MVGSLCTIAVKEEELGSMPMISIVHTLAAAHLQPATHVAPV